MMGPAAVARLKQKSRTDVNDQAQDVLHVGKACIHVKTCTCISITLHIDHQWPPARGTFEELVDVHSVEICNQFPS